MANEILDRLDALETNLGERFDRLDALETNLGERFDRLEAKVDRIQEDLQDHRKLVSDNFETVAETLEAILHGNSGPTRVAR